ENRVGRGGEPVSEEQIQGGGINFGAVRHHRPNGPHFGAEPNAVAVDTVIDELDSKRVARDDEALLANIPDGEPEHAVEAIQNVVTPLLVTVDDDFGVAVGAKLVAVAQQFALEFGEIVNLAVEDDPDRAFAIRHRLMAAGKIDDGETPEAEA